MKKQVAIFASGTGSNFEKIADDNRLKEKMDIALLVCDKPNAAVIKKAQDRNINTYVFSTKDFASKQDYEAAILEQVKDLDYIFLAGYMRIISPYFLENYKKALELNPKNGEAKANIAFLYLIDNKVDLAMRQLRRFFS